MSGDSKPKYRLDEVGVPVDEEDVFLYARHDGKEAHVVRIEGAVRGDYLNVDADGSLQSDSPQNSIRMDDTSTTNKTYFGYATPGTATSASAWRIFRLDTRTGLSDIPLKEFADGDTLFDNIWDNRASLSYS